VALAGPWPGPGHVVEIPCRRPAPSIREGRSRRVLSLRAAPQETRRPAESWCTARAIDARAATSPARLADTREVGRRNFGLRRDHDARRHFRRTKVPPARPSGTTTRHRANRQHALDRSCRLCHWNEGEPRSPIGFLSPMTRPKRSVACRPPRLEQAALSSRDVSSSLAKRLASYLPCARLSGDPPTTKSLPPRGYLVERS
jgi:hypothetical protein